MLRQCIYQNVRMRGDDDLRALRSLDKQVCNLGYKVGVEAEFRLFDAEQFRRLWVDE